MADEARQILRNISPRLTDVEQPIRNLSGGEQQAVAIGRCLAFGAEVVLMDEPTASMALWEQKKVLELILGLERRGRSLLMVTHNLPELFEVADRAVVLKEGRTVWAGNLQGLRPEILARMMFVGEA